LARFWTDIRRFRLRDFSFAGPVVLSSLLGHAAGPVALDELTTVQAALTSALVAIRALVKFVPHPIAHEIISASLAPKSSQVMDPLAAPHGDPSFRAFYPVQQLAAASNTSTHARPVDATDPAPRRVRQVTATILFADIENFTSLTEDLPPPSLSRLISDYFDIVVGLVLAHAGVTDKFIGDAVMAFWPSLDAHSTHEQAQHAVDCAVAIHAALGSCERAWAARGLPALRCRVGLHTGRCLLGNIGSVHHLSFTVLGDTVNVASRLEGLNKTFGTRTLMSEATLSLLEDAGGFIIRPLGPATVKGRRIPIRVFSIHSAFGANASCERLKATLFARALAAREEGFFLVATELCRRVLAADPADIPARSLLHDVAHLVEHPLLLSAEPPGNESSPALANVS
jgi:class 3 adenylate cyclase